MPDGVAVDKQKEARKIYKVRGKAWVSPEEPNHRKSTWLGMSSPALALQCHTKDWRDRPRRSCYCNMVNTCASSATIYLIPVVQLSLVWYQDPKEDNRSSPSTQNSQTEYFVLIFN